MLLLPHSITQPPNIIFEFSDEAYSNNSAVGLPIIIFLTFVLFAHFGQFGISKLE